MSSASQIRAGKAFVEIGLRDKLSRELSKIGAKLQAFGAMTRNVGAGLAGIGSAVLGSLGAASAVFASMGDELAKASVRTGITVEALSELKYAADQSDASFEDLQGGIASMAKMMFAASRGSKKANESLAALGVTVEELKSLSPEDQFKVIADRISKIGNPIERAALAMKAFGNGGIALLPMLQDGAAGIEAMQKQASELGLTMSTDDAKAADRFGTALGILWKQAKMVAFHVGAAVGRAVTPFLESVANAAGSVVAWVKENRGLVLSVGAIAGTVVAAGAALIVLGTSIQIVGFAVAGLMTGIAAVGAVFGALLSPLGLVTAALAGAAAAFFYFNDAARSALSSVATVAKDTFAGIAAALMKGDITLAGQIAVTALKLAWVGLKSFVLDLWKDITAGVASQLLKIAAGARAAFVMIADTMATVLDSALSARQATINTLGDQIAKLQLMAPKSLGGQGMSGDEADAAIQNARGKTDAADAQQAQQDRAKRAVERDAKLAAISGEGQAALQELARQQGEGSPEQNALREELAALKSQLAGMNKQASASANPALGAVADLLIGLPQQVASATEAAGKFSSAGTFNAAIAASLGNGNTAEKTLLAAQQSVQVQKRMLDELEQDDSSFSD